MNERKCIACNAYKDKKELIKVTRQHGGKNVHVNPDSKIFGRSAYLCYNTSCVEAAFKKNKLQRTLKSPIPEDLKGKIINEF